MRKSFFVVPALLVAGIFAASCSFNSVSPDMSFRVDLPRSTAQDDGSPDYNYAVYVTGRTEPWRGVVSQKNNVITLDEFPLGKGSTMYLGLSLASISTQENTNGVYPGPNTDTTPVGYSGQTVVDVFGPESSIDLTVKVLRSNGVFDFPVGETQTVSEIEGPNSIPGVSQNVSSDPLKIQIYALPVDMLSDKGELYMCSFSYQTKYEDNANEPTYGPEIYAECPVWLVSNNSQCSIILNNYTGQTITNVKLRRWADRTWHECKTKPAADNGDENTSTDWMFTW